MTLLSLASLLVLAAIGLAGAYHDLRFRRLPNELCMLALAAGLGFGLAQHGAGWAGMGLVHAVIALLCGIVLFALRVVGGGDVKFYAALAAWFPLKFGILQLAATALAGLVLGLAWLAMRGKTSPPSDGFEVAGDFTKVPYGVAISVGAIAAYLRAAV